MVKPLFDTVILIDYLNGVTQARAEMARYDDRAISIVSWMEVMAGAPTDAEASTRAFLDQFQIIPVDPLVAEHAVAIRKKKRLKLPDAIVWASALVHNRLFVTRDAKDFPANDPGVRIPYRI
jgi:predicted nucleic acid-binding protein